ncbi:putative transcriptional regulatory protein [Xenorhabdus poinarii G6]|uniref:Putative transcriptional regulatory protein n=1 Tax=Xenorhabdus poinarii G6 TaxID=1354304 RepID=A0A068QZ05_9GAMM|nr:helix-turn-helix transcriptional regulator [Xenorhabdus poinarii]CDG19901.1 putative transcriptional regulatory protein [Xenorhabdus poinarii G6]CDG22868.1 putative transcriptional regulatory protein [Xenorhabdus poinarii G6]
MQTEFLIMQNAVLRKEFGVRLKGLRKQKGWPQKELAAKVEVRFQQLNKYESGLNIPPAEMMVKLADVLGVTVDYLLTGNPVEDSPLASSRLFRRFQVLEQLEPEDQETVIKIIDAMIAKQRMESALLPVDEPEG